MLIAAHAFCSLRKRGWTCFALSLFGFALRTCNHRSSLPDLPDMSFEHLGFGFASAQVAQRGRSMAEARDTSVRFNELASSC